MNDTLRITLELVQADNPPLYTDLVRFPKGPRRVNRLRTLAFAGLLAQWAPHVAPAERFTAHDDRGNAELSKATLELFGPSIDS